MSSNESHTGNFASVIDSDIVPEPTATAFIDAASGESVTYDELATRVSKAGAVLLDQGVESGDRVGLFFPNELTYLYVLLGAMRIGAVPVPVNIQLRQELIDFIAEDSDIVAVVTSDRDAVRSNAFDAVRSMEPTPKAVFTATDDHGGPTTIEKIPVRSLEDAMETAPTSLDPASVSADDPAMQLYTSGSTGTPKGVVLTHGGIEWNTDAVGKAWQLDATERGLAATPLYHKNAMPGVKALLDRGGSTVIMDGFETTAVLRAIERYDITFITGVPAMFKMLLNEDETLGQYDLSSLAFAICGSAPVSPELHERFLETFDAPLLEAYGLTEGGPVVSLSPRWGVTKVGSTGLAIPGCETIVVETETDEPVTPGDVGELLVSNPGVGRYHNRPDENDRAFVDRDGQTFLRTGDLATKDEDGYHTIIGRVDDMMIVGGENVYPTEVEDLILSHEAVADVAVVPAPHETKREAPVAFVVADGEVTEDEVKQYTLDRGPAYAHPRRVFFLDALPLTGTEKVDRQRLETEATDRLDGPL